MKIISVLIIAIIASPVCNAQQWESFGTPEWFPRCMYTDSDANVLYVGGGFITMDGETIRGVGMWDGNEWSSLGLGIDYAEGGLNNVLAITKFQGEIIVAGAFSNAGGLSNTKFIARWDGTAWHEFNGQPNNVVNDLLVCDNKLYVVGGFDSLGTVRANGIGMWDGNNWHDVGNFPGYEPSPDAGNTVYTVQIFQDKLYLCGLIENPDQFTHFRLAIFDGIEWHPFLDDLKGAFAFGGDLEVYNNELYVGGYFLAQDGNYDNCIQRWNGTSWNSVGGGTSGPNETIWKLKVWDNKLYTAGAFTQAGGIPADNIAIWNGTKWCGLGSQFDGDINALEFYRDTLHVAGGFKVIDDDSVVYLAKWLDGDYLDSCSSAVGISEINSNDNNLLVYPNPMNNQLSIQAKGNEFKEILLINSLGEILISQPFQNSFNIDMSGFSPGLYLLQIFDQNRKPIQINKLIKQ